MNAQITAVLNTYLTRRVAMTVIAAVGTLPCIILYLGILRDQASGSTPFFAIQLIAWPAMGAALFLAQQAKWQFVHPRSRLTPHFAPAHVAVLCGLLLLVLGVYPLVASELMGVSSLGMIAFSALASALFVWGINTQRPAFGIAALAVLYSLIIPQWNGVWLSPGSRFVWFRLAALAAGSFGLSFWLFRLSRINEEEVGYFIATQSQFGQASRMEKSEARRNIARMLSHNKAGVGLSDRWHDRLAGMTARTDRERRRLMQYGWSSFPPVSLFAWLLFLMISILAMNWAMGSRRRTMLSGFMTMVMGPVFVTKLLSGRRVRLAQELLLPMSRSTLVNELLHTVAVAIFHTYCLAAALVVTTAMVWSPEMLTTVNMCATLVAAASIFPGLVGACIAAGLVKSQLKQAGALLGVIYFGMLIVGGCYALSRFVGLEYGILASGAVAAAGLLSIPFARRRWMAAELG